MDIPKDVYKLNSNIPLFLQALKLAGWYKGRIVDISLLEEEYSKFGYILSDSAKSLLAEYYGLRPGWKFRFKDKAGKIHIGGYDYNFETEAIYDECDEAERKLLPICIREKAIPLFIIGFHQFPKTYWLGSDNMLYGTWALDDKIKSFSSVHELLQHDIEVSSEGIFHIFKK